MDHDANFGGMVIIAVEVCIRAFLKNGVGNPPDDASVNPRDGIGESPMQIGDGDVEFAEHCSGGRG